MSVASRERIEFPELGKEQIRDLERMLKLGTPELVSPTGERLTVSPEFYEALGRMMTLVAEGRPFSVMATDQAITTQDAADILQLSRPFFIKLLDEGAMAFHYVGNQRRVILRDVLVYQTKREAECQAALDRLTVQAYEAGWYDIDILPEGSDTSTR